MVDEMEEAKRMSNLGVYQWLTTAAKKKVYSVTAEGISNEDLAFKIGDQFRMLETDKNAVLIEKIDDDDNSYFVSEELLTNISNYKC